MKSKRIFVGVCLVGLVLLIGLGVVYKVYAGDQEIVSPKDFGEGVYYFSIVIPPSGWISRLPTSRDPEIFGRSLAAFKASHTNLRVTGIASRNYAVGDYEYTVGYWVNFEEK